MATDRNKKEMQDASEDMDSTLRDTPDQDVMDGHGPDSGEGAEKDAEENMAPWGWLLSMLKLGVLWVIARLLNFPGTHFISMCLEGLIFLYGTWSILQAARHFRDRNRQALAALVLAAGIILWCCVFGIVEAVLGLEIFRGIFR